MLGKGCGYEAEPCGVNGRAICGNGVECIGGVRSGDLAGYVPAGNVVSKAWRVGGNAGDGKCPPDSVKCGFQFFGGWKMGNQGVLARFVLRIICIM